MKTFLDTNIGKTKSFILYGNLKDAIWCSDLMPRDLEHYLVKLLKSRGYEHIIFYGEAGTKGAYCLDEKSARFFFSANAGIPMPDALSGDFDDTTGGAESESESSLRNKESEEESGGRTGSSVSDELDSLFDDIEDDDYVPGDLSSIDDPDESDESGGSGASDRRDPRGGTGANAASSTVVGSGAGVGQGAASQQENSRKDQRVRYSFRAQTMSEFLQKIHPLMLKKSSRMAVVFYNILTTEIRNSDLRDDILDIWEKNSKGNICLMLVPETIHNTSALETKIRQSGLESKFLKTLSNSNQFMPNDINCLRICQPGVDELKNMLRYLSLIGTNDGNSIRFKYDELESIAQRIQYASGKRASQSSMPLELASEYMTEIFDRLSAYIDENAQSGQHLQLSVSDIDRAWDVDSDEGKALQELNKPGWEPAYDKISEVLTRIKKANERAQNTSGQTGMRDRKAADWGIQRIETVHENNESKRQTIPNFVLLGNPGTGKSTIARLIGRILHEVGMLKIGQTIEVKKENLTNSYVAGVPKATMAQVNAAEEGVLFIDEAHLLGKKDGGSAHDGTGVEVISTLNAAMTSPNHHFSVVLAGYEDEMAAVFELDQGFQSRFDNFIYLNDYSPELLTSILMRELETEGCTVDDSLTSECQVADTSYVPVKCMVDRLYSERDRKRFGNARDINGLASFAKGKCENDFITQDCFYGGLNGKISEEWFMPMDIGASTDYIIEEMNRKFVGMKEAKTAMKNIGLELEDYKARGIPSDKIELKPIILTGNPGVGKTSLAYLLPRLYFHYQLLGTSRPIIVHASSLADKYAGGSQEKVLEYIKKAQDSKGFLFVDEAHELLNEHFDGKGAFKAFMSPTTDKEHPFLACFAVYPNRLDEFLRIDPGAERRFRIIRLEDYTGEELYEIMKRMIAGKGYSTTEETDDMLRQVFDRVYLTRTESTGNAGKAENILHDMDTLRRQRCAASGIPFEDPASLVFTPDDIPEQYRKNLSVGDNTSGIDRLRAIREKIETERVGVSELKSILQAKADALIYQKKFPKRTKVIEPGHYFFKGNPGTGKTTGTVFFAKYMFELGMVQSPEPVFISASSLVGQYLGETGIKTRERLINSVGRVLMIDEAYALAEENSHANSYKRDAVNEIVNFLDNETYRKITCIVFAGYEHDMDALYQMNDGLKSRVTEVFFDDFTVEQSFSVLKSMLKDDGISLAAIAEDICLSQIEQMRHYSEFANGRTIRRYAGLLCGMLERRCIQNADVYEDDDPRAYEIQPEDVPDIETVAASLNLDE